MRGLFISKIKLKNFRKFEEIEIEINEDKTLLVGKNNTGKTSILKSLEIFEKGKLQNTDINLKCVKEIVKEIYDDEFSEKEVSLEVILNYNENCDFKVVSKYMSKIELKGDIVVKYSYSLSEDKIREFKKRINRGMENKDDFIFKNLMALFEGRTFLNGKEIKVKISDILNIKYIYANRKVDNEETNNTNSAATQRTLNNSVQDMKENIELRDIIAGAENSSNELLKEDEFFSFFKDTLSKLKGLSGNDEPNIFMDLQNSIEQPKVSLKFNKGGFYIPEYNSGLGYASFYSILLNILSFVDYINTNEIKNSLLIIEEPEAYTHPQMQYIFNDNIDNLIKETLNQGLEIQYIIVTHSPHLVTTSKLEDIIILTEINEKVESNKLSKIISDDRKFFKQYFKLTNSELLFADKVIFIEGDTEEILIKTFFQKYDEQNKVENGRPLMKQGISVLPVGTQAYKFQNIVKVLGIKALIITDIDFGGKKGGTCTYEAAIKSTNTTINKMIDEANENFLEYKVNMENCYYKDDICIAHQSKIEHEVDNETSIVYYPRSFEDAFLMTNYDLIKNGSLRKYYVNEKKLFSEKLFFQSGYQEILLSTKAKKEYRKAGFALELLISEENWAIPEYIKEGLRWIKE